MAVHAYLLVQTDGGRVADVAAAIATIDGVESAEVLTGPYDVIVRVHGTSVDELGQLVMTRIQAVEGIARTLTCPVVRL